jgi:hypothetical protein
VERPPAYELIHGRRVACFLVDPSHEHESPTREAAVADA